MAAEMAAMWTARRTFAFWLLALLVAASIGVLAAEPAHAATFTVNSTADTGDTTPDGTCDTCTLREAIQEANANEPTVDLINFAIPGAGPHTISPASELPPITEAVTINGYSESLDETTPATANTLPVGNNAVLKIELDGTNVGNGLRIQAANSTVKGLIINRFQTTGVGIDGSGATGNKVEGNYIGTDAAGTADLGNIFGVDIRGSNNTVGGTEAGARNVISGNAIGVAIFLSGATGNQVMGNYIGTKANGTEALGNNLGVLINGASNNTVGGTLAGARNVISGSTPSQIFGLDGGGVHLSFDATGNQLMGNYIGTDASGTQPLGNSGNGVLVYSGASNNTIGGTTAGAGNIISGNGGDGVEVNYYRDSNNPEDNDPTPATGNRILSNSIYDNNALGIDLFIPPNQLPGVTKNDKKDPDTGPNRLQNFPALSSATLSGGQITLSGKLNSRPRKSFTIQFFSSPTEDTSTYGEGKIFLGEKTVRTNREGKRSFSTTFSPLQPVSPGEKITATATNNPTGDTSEFSKAVTAS